MDSFDQLFDLKTMIWLERLEEILREPPSGHEDYEYDDTTDFNECQMCLGHGACAYCTCGYCYGTGCEYC